MSNKQPVIIKQLGLQDYELTWRQMQQFVAERTPSTINEIWLVEHPEVFTQGQAGKKEHLLGNPQHIPVISTDRGGQITCHAPGQLVFYLLIDVKRRAAGIRKLVSDIEQSVIAYLASLQLHAYTKAGAPGIYLDKGKIAFLGLKVKNGYTYHGLSFNYDNNLTAFSYINPCGYENLAVTRLVDLISNTSKESCVADIVNCLCYSLGLEDVS